MNLETNVVAKSLTMLGLQNWPPNEYHSVAFCSTDRGHKEGHVQCGFVGGTEFYYFQRPCLMSIVNHPRSKC